MKRFFAMFIDLSLISTFFYFYTCLFDVSSNQASQNLYKLSWLCLYLFYNFIVDYFFEGVGIGKKILGIKGTFTQEKKFVYGITHGLVRLLCYILLPFTGIYYLVTKGKIPYDKWYAKERT